MTGAITQVVATAVIVFLAFLLGGSKQKAKSEKELNDALEHEAQSWADIAHTDSDFIGGMSERINDKHKAKD